MRAANPVPPALHGAHGRESVNVKSKNFLFSEEKRNKKDFIDAGSATAVAALPQAHIYKSLFASFPSEKEGSYFSEEVGGILLPGAPLTALVAYAAIASASKLSLAPEN